MKPVLCALLGFLLVVSVSLSAAQVVPVVIAGDTLFTVAARNGKLNPEQRVQRLESSIQKLINNYSTEPDSIYVLDDDQSSEIRYKSRLIYTVIDNDTIGTQESREELAQQLSNIIADKITSEKEIQGRSYWLLLKNIGFALLLIVVQVLLIRLTSYLYNKQRFRMVRFAYRRVAPLNVKNYEILNQRRIAKLIVGTVNVLRWSVNILQLLISVPILFVIFPQTEQLAYTIFSYILSPIKSIFWDVVEYIPNIFNIIIIWLCIRYSIRGLGYIAKEIETGKLKITGFFPDWAKPSYNILRFLLYAFMIAMIYPYLPGADKGVFQGVSVFLGLMVSLGSTAVIGNVVAGMVITYMRPFKLGDRIRLNDTVGDVVEKTPFVTRIKTPKNEVITIPNSFILSTQTINYSASAREHGLIIHSTITIGYDAPWRTVHALLVSAAQCTRGVERKPQPFVLETELSDFYVCYQINAYIKDAQRLAQIYSDLHQNIQDKFNDAGIEIMSPHYRAERDGSQVTIPESYRTPPSEPPSVTR